ncbi:hypothetical protein AIOL_004221 [Candidatus Rhodobacter oscarellae]|uniref:Nitrogen fixation protein n=1 Tax=Candidatus Rhodobacter oscarellae TaxID=1675527 RepID=A0A0J9E8X5_9RHOB|nr:hypothetical protein [Candidatus Rhodobacter lobularis]KMW59240.1 hypothetical protein AIOL_004221 [Candidatus Rhodobacter lobularis]
MADLTCPSARAAPGAKLIGTLGADGRVKPLRTPLEVDADFIARAKRQGEPEARMRFAAPCAQGGCGHWTGQACGLIDRVLDHIATLPQDVRAKTLPPCTIRGDCRWYHQTGAEACRSCDLVVRLPAEPVAAE